MESEKGDWLRIFEAVTRRRGQSGIHSMSEYIDETDRVFDHLRSKFKPDKAHNDLYDAKPRPGYDGSHSLPTQPSSQASSSNPDKLPTVKQHPV
jgi:hypothetical protein